MLTLVLMKAALTQALEMSVASGMPYSVCSHSFLGLFLAFFFFLSLPFPPLLTGNSAVMEQSMKMKCNNLKIK